MPTLRSFGDYDGVLAYHVRHDRYGGGALDGLNVLAALQHARLKARCEHGVQLNLILGRYQKGS